MGSLRHDIIERLRFETELAGPLVPQASTQQLSQDTDAAGERNPSALQDSPNSKQPNVSKPSSTTTSSGTTPKPEPKTTKNKSKTTASPTASTDPYERIEKLIPEGSPLLNFTTLKEVEDYVANTILIELDRIRKNPVFGVGNPDADLLVIGEAPGANEDEQGEPFVGRAGKLLTDILAAIKFSRDDVYIANILKSRPTDNRNPTADEIAAHIPILHKQIALIRPKMMMCVGKVAANSLLGNNSSLASMRGSFQDYHGLPVLVTYHPAALLRNPEWKKPTWEDVQRLRARFDELVGKTTK